MKKLIFFLLALISIATAYAQTAATKKYSPQQLKDDVEFLKKQLFDAHANPFTELNKQQYEQVFADIEANITDSLNIAQFYKLIRPAFSYLSDEHSDISFPRGYSDSTYQHSPIYLPFDLQKRDGYYFVVGLVSKVPGLAVGDKILKIGNVAIADLVKRCSMNATGFPDQRMRTALLYFNTMYPWVIPIPQEQYKILTDKGEIVVNGVDSHTVSVYKANLNIGPDQIDDGLPYIDYKQYGDIGYINTPSFLTHNDKQFKAFSDKIDSVFMLIKKGNAKYLFIDISRNEGGNSAVGDVLIQDFYSKPYRTYQCNWRRSDEYLKLITKWGIKDDNYAAKAPGSILHFDSDTITPVADNSNRFNGKVYIMVGDGTFSSAMMFATIIKDNHIATLIGQTPQNGHPDHFGELYNAKLPNTGLQYRFGVKEWIRPAGKLSDNYLRPDVEIDSGKSESIEQIIHALAK